jgi:opacity protein-like surface antigen
MRRLFAALGLTASISGACAQEFELPTLRGADLFVPAQPVIYSRWDGFYVGGQLGFGFANSDFKTTTQDLVAHMLRELALENEAQVSTWQVLGQANTRGVGGGAFFGYNSSWEGAILGFDFNYNRVNFGAQAPMSPIERVVAAGGNVYDVVVAGQASMHVVDFATLRARAGFEAYNFLPYVSVEPISCAPHRYRVSRIRRRRPPAYPLRSSAISHLSPLCIFRIRGEERRLHLWLVARWRCRCVRIAARLPASRIRVCRIRAGHGRTDLDPNGAHWTRREILTTRCTLGTYQRILPRTMQPSCLPHPPSPVFRS